MVVKPRLQEYQLFSLIIQKKKSEHVDLIYVCIYTSVRMYVCISTQIEI